MTINSSTNKTIALGNGSQTQFGFSFVGVAAAYISVIYTDASGNETVLTQGSGATQYQIALNAPVQGAIWGLGGTVTYDPSGTPIPAGSTLTIFRTLPLTQAISLQNQISLATLGAGAETGLDTGTMQLQQVFEQIARAIAAPISDPTPPLPLPPIAQRANMGAVFDGLGNLTAGSLPSSGVISTAMQPVVDAATLALGRTALGLGAMAQEGIGGGLQDDGAGNARVYFPVSQVATNHNVAAADHLNSFLTTGPVNFTYPRANTLFNGFGHWIYNNASGAITLVVDSHDTFQGYPSGQAIEIPANASAFISTDGATNGNWLIEWGLATGVPMSGGTSTGLVIQNNATTPNSQIDVTASEITMPNVLSGAYKQRSVAFTINCTTVGLNGMDTGVLPTSGWIYIYAISNGAVTGGLASLSSTNPTMPAGYTYRKRIGAMPTDGSAHLYRVLQKANRAKYVVTPSTNTASPRSIISQSSSIGNVNGTYVAASVTSYVPPTAILIGLQLMVVSTTSGPALIVIIAPNNNYGGIGSTTNMPPITSVADISSNQQFNQGILAQLMLESSNIYIASTGGANLLIAAESWIDDV